MKLLLTSLLLAGTAFTVNMNPYLPNHNLTPGALNTNITQNVIHNTICVAGFTATERPTVSYTNKLKRLQIGQYKYSDTQMRDYEEDHLISLELGGNPTSPANLWPEPYASNCGARTKDKIEGRLHTLVCSGKITLLQAQTEISTDWVESYNDHIGKLVCN
jgi:hypothetical protein